MLLLRLLEEKDMYGYEMIDQLRQKSDNVFELKWVRCIRCCIRWRKADVSPLMRGNCREEGFITGSPRGRKQLKKKTEEWSEYASAVMHVMELTLE